METVLELLKSLLETYSGVFPSWLLTVFMVIGSLRILFKPVFSLFKAVTEFTYWTDKDNKLYDKIVESKIYKSISYVLDYVASIKLPEKKK